MFISFREINEKPDWGIYDSNGNLTNKTDARGVQTSYIYDALNRVTNRNYLAPAGLPNYGATPNVAYTYDNLPNAKGKLTKVSSADSTTEYTSFDSLGRVLAHRQTTDGNVYTTAYVYNLSGALIEETYPSTRVVKNTLDADGDLSQVQSKKNASSGYQNYAGAFTYTAAGAVSSMRLGNGRWESTIFNSRLQPVQIALGNVQNAANLLKLNYDYGTTANNGNVLSQQITVPTVGGNAGFTAIQNYNYDSLNRLKDASETVSNSQSWKQTFQYDRFGNRTFDTSNNNTTTLAANCPTNVCNPSANTTNNRLIGASYDLSGNTITDAGNRTFVYDGENKQTEVKNSSNQSVGQYVYDGDGKRVKKLSAAEITIFVYDAGGKMVAEYSTATNPTPQTSYLTSDNLGTPRISTDQTGAVISRHDYQPFGEEAVTAQRVNRTDYQGDAVRNQFTGYQKDEETDLDFAQARMYSNKLGRFMNADPLMASARSANPQTWNRYSYAVNNPFRFNDPEGLSKKPVFLEYSDIYDDQKRILENSQNVKVNGKEQSLKGQALYEYLAKNDPKALANFLNQTTALMNFQFALKDKDGTYSIQGNALQLVNNVSEINDERIKGEANPLLNDLVNINSVAPKGTEPYWDGPENSGGNGIGKHGEYDVSFRQNMSKGPQQMSFSSTSGFKKVDIDIDYDLNRGIGGRALHIIFQGAPNFITRGQSDPYKIFKILQENPQVGIKPNYHF